VVAKGVASVDCPAWLGIFSDGLLQVWHPVEEENEVFREVLSSRFEVSLLV